MLKGLQAILGLVGGMICSIALAVLGYFSIFKGLDWIYLVVVLAVYLVCVVLVMTAAKKGARYSVYCEMMSGGFGWVWILSIIASIWFVVSALFMDGSWWEVGYSVLVGGLCKGWTRSFMEAQREDEIILSPEHQRSWHMAISIDAINTKAATYTIVGWFAGLAYFNWFASAPQHVSWIGHAILIVIGMFVASILIGGGVALVLGYLTKALTGRAEGSPDLYAWGVFISPVIAFFAAELAIGLTASNL